MLNAMLGANLKIDILPKKGSDKASYKKALAKYDFDCAIISVPDHLHYKIASDIIRKNIHTMIVKPLTSKLKEAKSLEALANKRKVYGAVEFHKRFDEANLKLKDLINSKNLGDILYFAVEYSQKKSIPAKVFKDWAAKTNIFQYLGVHYVDLIHFLTGAKPLRVMATGQKNSLKRKGINTYDAIQALIEWKMPKTGNKFTSSILTNWIDPDTTSAVSDQKIKIIGTKGRCDSDQKNRGVQIVTQKEGIEDFNPYFSQFYPGVDGKRVFKGYGEKSIRQFLIDVEDIKKGIKKAAYFCGKRPTFKDSLVSTAVIDVATRSLEKDNSWVKINL